jgi:hypothetical protein
MNVKMYILSLAAIAVIGCGGSNSSSCCKSGIAPGEKAEGNGVVVADTTGKTNLTIKAVVENKDTNTSKTPTSSVTVTNVQSSNGTSVCQTKEDGCDFSVVQTASKCDNTEDKPEFNLSSCDEQKAETFFKGDTTKFDPSKEVVVYGGTLEITDASGTVDTCGLDVSINLPQQWCGKELKSGKQVGFANVAYRNGETMWALITVATDGCSTTKVWKKARVVDGKILLENLQGVKLPAKFVLFSVMAKPDRLSGATGIFGG